MAKNKRVARIINVSREQMDLYRDHEAFSKMDYVFNCVPFSKKDIEQGQKVPFCERRHIVTYMGSLVTQKRFHVLASIWPDILKEVPDAELYVIGNGRLHNGNVQLGKYGIAAADYESLFMPFLINHEGDILESVHFMGNMGVEKNEILRLTKVGVPNPTGLTETFCLCAVEMQSMGAVVTAMKSPGYFDTFINGVLVNNKLELKKSIVNLLLSNYNYQDCNAELIRLFSIECSISKWEEIFSRAHISEINEKYDLKNTFYRLKWLKEIIRKGKEKRFLPKQIPSIEIILAMWDKVVMKMRGY